MTIGRAIEIVTISLQFTGKALNPDLRTAMELCREAAKDYQKLKLTTFLPIGYKLPGETEESNNEPT